MEIFEESTEEKFENIQKKCGEIFMNEYENLNFLCTFCAKIVEDIETFKNHIKNYHNEQCKQKNSTLKRRKSSLSPSSSKSKQKTSTITPNIEFISFDYVEAKEEPNSPLLTSTISDNKDNIQLELTAVDYKIEEEDEEEKYLKKMLSQKFDNTDETPKSTDDLELKNIELNLKEKDECESLNSRIKSKTKNIIPSPNKSKRKNKEDTFCDICKKKFYSIVSLRSHLKYDHETKNSLTHEFAAEDDLLEDSLKCRYCKRKFRNRKDRYEHEYSHTGQKPYECDVCGKRYYIRYAYKNHIAIHKNERPFKCEICSAGFNSSSTLLIHIRRHKNEKKYKCSYCDKKFVYSTPLKIHERVHTGEKPYQCTECGICLISSSSLRKHIICYHTIDKPYKCQYCSRPFSANREKREHERIHTGEKPFICEICSASFRTGRSLKNHRKTHSNENNKISDVEQSTVTT